MKEGKAPEILVVEDHDDLREVVEEVLRHEGFSVVAVANGKAALEHLFAAATTPRLIVMDMNMPVMTGPQLMAVLQSHARFSTIPVVVTSSMRAEAFPREGTVGWLRKPYTSQALLALVRPHVTAAARRSAVSRDQASEAPDRVSARLGDLLYPEGPTESLPESDWVELVRAIAGAEQQALRALFERTHHLVFTLALRIIDDRETAEEVTLEVFRDVWRRSAQYDPNDRSVLGWIANLARSGAIDRLRFGQRKKPVPTDRLLWAWLAKRIRADSGGNRCFADKAPRDREAGWGAEPEWKEVASGISCKLLATDRAKERVSMLVRLAPGVTYPSHRHAGIEELHLLDGELWIDARKLRPGDYSRAEPGTADSRVWSETGCTCLLLTSYRDVLC